MANPQKENGYTAIANEILEALIRYKFPPKSGIPLKICLFVIRKTYGYRKKMDIISLSQFQEAIGENNRTNLIYWLKLLVQARILVRIKKSETQIEYGFNKDYEEWLTPVQVKTLVQVRSYSSASTSTSGSASNCTETSASTSTHKRKKETIKEITKETSEQSSRGISILIKSFETINKACSKMYGNTTQRNACKFLIETYGIERVKTVIEKTLPKTNTMQFFPSIITPCQLQDKWSALENAIKKYQSEKLSIKEKYKII